MEPYTDIKYSDCGCSGRCRKVSGNQNQSVRSCLDPAMQAGNVIRYPQMGNPMNDGMMPENRMTGQTPRMMPENGMAGQMPHIMPANNGTGRLPANDATMQVPQNGNNWENNRDFGWNYMPGLEGNAFCPGSMPGVLEKDYPLAMAYVPWQQWKNPYGPERGLAQGTIFSELDLAFDKGRCS